MTDTTVAPATTDAATAPEAVDDTEARKAAVQAALDDFGRMALDRLVAQITERNGNVERLLTVGGDRITRLDSMRADLANGTDVAGMLATEQQVQKLLAKVAELQEQRDKALNEQIDKEIASSDVDPVALAEIVKQEDASIRQGLNYAEGLYGKDFELLLPERKPLKGSRGSGTSKGGESGKRRLRGFTVSVDGVVATTPDKDGVQKSSFSAAAKVLGYKSVETLSDMYRRQYGDNPDNFPAEATFEISDSEGKIRKVVAVKQ